MKNLTKDWIKTDLKNDYIVEYKKHILSIFILNDKQSCIVKLVNTHGVGDYVGTLKHEGQDNSYISWERLALGWENWIC